MALKWLKLHSSLLHNVKFQRMKLPSQLVFFKALMLAQECDMGGFLAIATGPLSTAEIAQFFHIPEKQTLAALKENELFGFLRDDTSLGWLVNDFIRYQETKDAERMRRWRSYANKGVTESVTVTPHVTPNVREPLRTEKRDRDTTLRVVRDSPGTPPEKPPVQTKLPDPETLEAGRILKALWPLSEPAVRPRLTRRDWFSQNAGAARSAARGGMTPEELVQAHAALSKIRGYVVWRVAWVVEFLVNEQAKKTKPPARKYMTPEESLALDQEEPF